jgi:Protein of unknown function (DUF3999)
MKTSKALLALILFASPSISYFKFQRPVQVAGGGQHYFAVDETLWRNAQPDLSDLRLYSGLTEYPYALVIERGSMEHEHTPVRVLQQSAVAGKTQFIIDMSGVVEYDHIDLKLASRDFVAHAKVEGQDDLHGPHWAELAGPILYDLSKEGLGGNSMLRLPLSTYKYLRVTIDGPVKPADIQGATAEFREEQQARWRNVAETPKISSPDHDTVLTFDVPKNVPVERVSFAIDPNQPNFRRAVEIRNDRDVWLGSGEISKVHMVRNGNKIDADNSTVEFSTQAEKTIKVIIHNGDDKPLQQSTRLEQHERRIYFDASAAGALTLYYGDEKLGPPVYDYAKLFQMEKNVVPAQLGAAVSNSAYAGRPDERPWTERHPGVLWIAIVGAVVVLGAVALRSVKTATAA